MGESLPLTLMGESLTTDLNGGVFDGHNAGHDVNDPLRRDDNMIPQEVIVKVLHRAEIM